MPESSSLRALLDTLLPGGPADGHGRAYPSATTAGLDEQILRLVAGLSATEQAQFASLLRALDSRLANLLLTGRPVRFSTLGPAARERYLLGWATSRLALKRKGFHAIKRLAGRQYFAGPLQGAPHPLWDRIHYEVPELRPPSLAPPPDLPGVGVPVRPEAPVDGSVDVCVIGSGAGGGVIAARLAQAGYSVAVLEAGPWVEDAAYPRIEREAVDRLFVGRGLVTTRDGAIGILAGEGVGGGTAINWMTCLPPRPEARSEWARDGGMTGVEGAEFDRRLTRVAERLHVRVDPTEVNANNDALRRGCEALGYRPGPDWDLIPRNAVGCDGRCGFCTFGCVYGARQSGRATFLEDALRAGARLYPWTRADTIELSEGKATGVMATTRREGRPAPAHFRARAVVVAAGALQTPALLLRSGIRHPGVGRGLRLDPTVALAGEFPMPVRPWIGAHQTIRVLRFQTTDPEAHGPWIEVAPAHPGLTAVALPWAGARDYLQQMERIERVATPIVLVRDVGEGRVEIDREGAPRFDYRLTSRDRANLVRGLVETARILQAAGATRLLSLNVPYVTVGDGLGPVSAGELDAFVAGIQRAGIRENAIALFSAHPLGSARAGGDPRTSAARPTGEVHGVDGLWIGDGSLLPSAPGANPMLSILALADRTADQLIGRLQGAN